MFKLIQRAVLACAALLITSVTASAQSVQTVRMCFGSGCTVVSAGTPLPVTGTISVSFPTIGSPVPSTGIYNGINVGGTLRGWSGLSTGSLYPGAVAIVDASGNQITTFGSSVAGYEFQLAPTITVDAGAYAAGDSMGGLVTLTGAARTAGGSGILNGIRLKSTGGSTNTIWIYGWSKTPTATCTNNAAYVPNAADNAFALVGFPTSVTLGGAPGAWDTATYAQLSSLISNFKNQDTVPGTALYFCLVTAAGVTPATTSDLTMVASGMQD